MLPSSLSRLHYKSECAMIHSTSQAAVRLGLTLLLNFFLEKPMTITSSSPSRLAPSVSPAPSPPRSTLTLFATWHTSCSSRDSSHTLLSSLDFRVSASGTALRKSCTFHTRTRRRWSCSLGGIGRRLSGISQVRRVCVVAWLKREIRRRGYVGCARNMSRRS